MRAAIYARKSTDDSDRNPDNKSVTRQVEHARAYATAKGWSVADEHVFIDDGISGAEFLKRPGLLRMLARSKEFNVIVMSELSRLGRDQVMTSKTLSDIEGAGVKVHLYLTKEELRFDSAIDRFMVSAINFGAELEREKAAERSRDALERKAKLGYNTGGRVYGYDNVQVFQANAQGEQVRSHTEYRINPEQADVIRRIFTMYADGYGHVTVAKTLNGDPRYAARLQRYFDGIAPPKPVTGRRGTGSWAPSSIRAMLLNDRYTGVIPFGEFKKSRRGGTKVREKQADFLTVPREELRIIDAALWAKAQERLQAVAKTYLRDTNGELWGQPGKGVESKYLLSGLGSCGCCGHNIAMLGGRSGVPGRRSPIFYYGCSYHTTRGNTVCANDHKVRLAEADAAVIDTIRERVLTPAAIEFVLDEALSHLADRQREEATAPERLQAAIRQARQALDNFLRLIAEGKAPETVLRRIAELETEIEGRERELGLLTLAQPSELELRRVKRDLRERLGRFDELISGDVPLARQALRKLLNGRIEFDPVVIDGVKGYELRWQTKIGALLCTPGYKGVASPRGFEPRLPP